MIHQLFPFHWNSLKNHTIICSIFSVFVQYLFNIFNLLTKLPSRLVFMVFFFIGVTADGDYADRGTRSVWNNNGLVLFLAWKESIGGRRCGTQRAAPYKWVDLSWNCLQGRCRPIGKYSESYHTMLYSGFSSDGTMKDNTNQLWNWSHSLGS